MQTPVGDFAREHAALAEEPARAKVYKQLLPLSKPGVGEQYAFHVDLDKCTGCKACVSACHSLNGLDEHETWRDAGSIHGSTPGGDAYAQTVTTACHHCADPGCLNGCPVLAYEKDPLTGIVHHLDDQCIGCQYCVLKCPYDVPKYSKKLGIVRKCDMCHSRLAEGEAPACVQACPTEAISITVVNTEEATSKARLGEAAFLPAAPDPAYTVPTTEYVTKRTIPANAEAGDRHALEPEHAHFPLVFMLVLTQLSVGLYAGACFAAETLRWPLAGAGFVAMAAGLASSTAHLGRPLGAWRAFLGLRRSWLSREIVTFGGFSVLATAFTASTLFALVPWGAARAMGAVVLFTGLAGVFTSAMIYHDTQRPFWRLPVSAGKFFGSTLLLGLAAWAAAGGAGAGPCAAVALVKLALEASQLKAANHAAYGPAKKSALLMLRPLRTLTLARYAAGGCGAALMLAGLAVPALVPVAAVLLLAGEVLERTLYFQAVAAPKMPGGLKA
ncbi:MAG: DmsC/YnfH family molybdoenzyme membrane anchor subunit [Opitutales bacterium]